MEYNFCYSFPAIKGYQANKNYYIAMCPLKIIPKLFLFNDEELPPDFRAQRVLNKTRIPDITNYIIDNPTDYVFSSLTASIDGDIDFIPIGSSSILGNLHISMESRFLINDGQHRRAAIEEALKVNPDLGEETISVVFYVDQGLQNSQQMFADLNKHAVNTTKSISILYDSRDPLAKLTKEIISKTPFLKTYTDKENSTLSKLSSKLFTISSIYNTNARILSKSKGEAISNKDRSFTMDFWHTLSLSIKEWEFINEKKMSPSDYRKNYINTFGLVLEALGQLGNYLYKNNIKNWKTIILDLNKIDWSRENELWEGCVISQGRIVNKNSKNIIQTYKLIKKQINLI